MDLFSSYFSTGAWHVADWNTLSLPMFLLVLFIVRTLSDYRSGFLAILLLFVSNLIGMILSAADVFYIRPQMAAFIYPVLVTGLAVFNIFGAGAKPSAILEKTGYAMAILFALTHGLSLGAGYSAAIPLAAFCLGFAVGTLVVGLIVLCLSSLASFFGVNRRDFVLVVSSVSIGVMIPYLIRYFPFTVR